MTAITTAMLALSLAACSSGCTESFLTSAQANCETFQESFVGSGERCDQPDPHFDVECHGVMEFDLTADRALDCRAWLDQQPCETFDTVAWPDYCSPTQLRFHL